MKNRANFLYIDLSALRQSYTQNFYIKINYYVFPILSLYTYASRLVIMAAKSNFVRRLAEYITTYSVHKPGIFWKAANYELNSKVCSIFSILDRLMQMSERGENVNERNVSSFSRYSRHLRMLYDYDKWRSKAIAYQRLVYPPPPSLRELTNEIYRLRARNLSQISHESRKLKSD